jgi:hypothetical protein
MYQDKAYLDRINNIKEVEVSYSFFDKIEIEIKTIIDAWLKSQVITLSNQDKIRIELRKKYEDLANDFKIIRDSDFYLNLSTEVMEMLSMRLTILSLMESISDDSFEPIPINLLP